MNVKRKRNRKEQKKAEKREPGEREKKEGTAGQGREIEVEY